MEAILEFLKTDTFLIINGIMLCILFLGFFIMMARLHSINKNYKTFLKKLGNGENIEEDLENYMYRVEKVEKQNLEILSFCHELEKNVSGCVQKVGIVRYSAFKDTGSDLSFALAMLDENNNGVVLNGIYSREMSNIYAKPVENGKSKYTITEEEEQAINKAIESKAIYKVKDIKKNSKE